MPRNGSGSYNLPNGPFVPSTVISSTVMNQNLSDLGTALTQSIANDGQTTPVANLPMATFRHTNVGNAVARNDYAAAGQVQDSSFQWLTSVAGTNTITASVTPSPTAYVAGQTFRFVAAGANTGAVTLNINGLGAKSITKSGTTALVSGDIPSGSLVEVTYDGTNFQIGHISRGEYIATQVFTASGTYTPDPRCRLAIVEVLGAGGGGGGAAATGVGQFSIGAGGGSGAFSRGVINSPAVTAITVGVGGSGQSGGGGLTGGQSSFGGNIVCLGGIGGGLGAAGTTPAAAGGAGGSISVGGTLVSISGSPGYSAWANVANVQGVTGAGGNSFYGYGGTDSPFGNISGVTASNYGSGGSGAFNLSSQPARTGGSGSNGIVIINEYT